MLNKSLPKAPPKFVIYKCNNYGAAGSRYGNKIKTVHHTSYVYCMLAINCCLAVKVTFEPKQMIHITAQKIRLRVRSEPPLESIQHQFRVGTF